MSAPRWTPGPWHVTGKDEGPGKRHLHIGAKTSMMCLASMNEAHIDTPANAYLMTAAPDFAAAAASLIEAWDARTTGAQQIITGKSDADLQKQAMAAIEGLRAALAKAGAA